MEHNKHTPTPWSVVEERRHPGVLFRIYGGAGGRSVVGKAIHAYAPDIDRTRRDYALIVRAVNAHDALVDALVSLAERVGCLGHTGHADGCHCESCGALALLK